MTKCMLVVPGEKEKIEKMALRYREYPLEKGVDTVVPMDANNKILVAATAAVGISSEVDAVVPGEGLDPMLIQIAGLIKCPTSVVENTIDELAMGDKVDMQVNGLDGLIEQYKKIIKKTSEDKEMEVVK